MSPKNNVIKNILDNLEQRKKQARFILADICQNSTLPDILGRHCAWAIVGGSVRDCLLARDPYTRTFFSSWPDVDVAIAGDKFDINERLSNIEDMEFSAKHNTFGGWKVINEDMGELDIWRVKLDKNSSDSLDKWLMYLDNVDFAINAVAFLWPECQVVIHHRWCESLRKQRVAKLSPYSIKRHLQPIRGIALAVKLKETTNLQFKLGRDVADDLIWVTTNKDENIICESLKYLQDKVSSGRWPFLVLQRFLLESANIDHGDTFYELVGDILAEDLKQYVNSTKGLSRPPPESNMW